MKYILEIVTRKPCNYLLNMPFMIITKLIKKIFHFSEIIYLAKQYL